MTATHIAAFIIGFAAGITALLVTAYLYAKRQEGKRLRRNPPPPPPPRSAGRYREDEPDA